MNRSGHYSTTSWISNPLDWFINGVGLRRMFYIWVCDIEKVLGSRTDQHWFIFQNSHADSETIIRYEVSPCQVLVKWSKSESDHHLIIIIWSSSSDNGFHELLPLLLPPLWLHHHRHRCSLPLRRRLRHRALDDHRDWCEPLCAGLHPDHRLPPDVPLVPGHDLVTQVSYN